MKFRLRGRPRARCTATGVNAPFIRSRHKPEAGAARVIPSPDTYRMALSVLAYNPTRVMNIVGIKPLLAAIRA